jgi:hypothetical protein
MKKYLSVMITMVVVCVLFVSNASIAAYDDTTQETTTTYVYLDNGDYIETTIISNTSPSRSSINATKTSVCKNSSDEPLWSVSITATFTYNGTSSSCTYASGSSETFSNWQVTAPTVRVSGASATSSATGRIYLLGFLISEKTLFVTLSCSPTGVLT